MATDEQFTVNFSFHEWPGWEWATTEEKAVARERAVLVYQPLRRQFGRTVITSWMWWMTGANAGVRRTGAHADPGTVDLVFPDEIEREFQKIPLDKRNANLQEAQELAEWRAHNNVKEWAATHLVPAKLIGELINERNHLHLTRWGVGGYGEVLVEPVEGDYQPGFALGSAVALLLALSIFALAIFALFEG